MYSSAVIKTVIVLTLVVILITDTDAAGKGTRTQILRKMALKTRRGHSSETNPNSGRARQKRSLCSSSDYDQLNQVTCKIHCLATNNSNGFCFFDKCICRD